ncbi:MAG TPA: caspase family protein, partial [Methyloceanibacter sp.]|nr:caspase family protein [Methyloceanibacter sp.]
EAIRRSQERHQAAEPQGCPPGLVPSKHGCKPAKNRGPEITQCAPPMQMRKGKCVPPKGPEVARCEPPMEMRKGKCVPRKEPQVAKCDHDEVYRKGKGCVPVDRGPQTAECDHDEVYRKGKGCVPVDRGPQTVDCERPFIPVGKSCACPPGLIQRGHDCKPPTVVVVPPPVVVPVPPPVGPGGPGPVEPPHVVPAATPPAGPPPPREASPLPPKEPKPIQSLAKVLPAANRCLPEDLYDLLEQTYGKRPALDRCPSACLPKPASFTPAELDAAAAKSGINWCDNCVQVGGYMPLASVLQLEKAANVTICVNPDMCRLPAAIGGADAGERVVEIRTVFKDLPAGVKNEGNIAVVVGNQDYLGDLPDNPDGKADADAVMALLVDQLGYKQENIIDLRDATLSDFERVFGSESNPQGELAKRIDKKDPGDVFIYVASHGMVKEDDAKEAYLLPVDAKLDDLDKTAYPMQELYDHLGKIGARTIMLMLEANFAKNLDELINPPNLPELEVEAMPVDPVPGLAVFKASDRDQKTIKDPEYGIGLFTRYMIEGLAGRADAAPLGNDDKRIDTVELYVYTADAVRTAARKSFGLEQKPLLSKIDNLVVGNLTSN